MEAAGHLGERRAGPSAMRSSSTTRVRSPSPVRGQLAEDDVSRLFAAEGVPAVGRAPPTRSGPRPAVSTHRRCPAIAISWRNPRLVITVTTTVSCARAPRLVQVDRAQGDDLVAVDQCSGVLHRQQPVGVAVEGDADVGSEGHDRGLQVGRVGRPAVVVDVDARRARRQGPTPAPSRRSTSGPSDCRTRSRSRRRPTDRRGCRAVDRTADRAHVGVDDRSRRCAASPDPRARWAPSGPFAAQDLGDRVLDLRLFGIGELAAAGSEDLDPVVGERVVDWPRS